MVLEVFETVSNMLCLFLVADRWRVVLKAEYPDYICASFVNVSMSFDVSVVKTVVECCVNIIIGIQEEEGLHCNSGSHE